MTIASTSQNLSPTALRIVDVAEQLCADHGLEAVSVRDIAGAAGVSLSVIYHHFGSKAGLLKVIMQQRMEELGRLRNPLFAELATQSKPDLDKLLYAIIAPLALLRARGKPGETTVAFLARALLSTLPEIVEEVDISVSSLRQLVDLTQRAAPHLSREEVCWRLHFTFGIEHMTHWDYSRLEIMSDGIAHERNVHESIARAIAFAKAAFLAE